MWYRHRSLRLMFKGNLCEELIVISDLATYLHLWSITSFNGPQNLLSFRGKSCTSSSGGITQLQVVVDQAALGNGSYKKVYGFCTFVHTMWIGTKLHRGFTSDVHRYL
jgi:hypothetical protein